MNAAGKHILSLVSVLLLCTIIAVIYPYYQYYIDTDATSYLIISQRYANGDYLRAINGYWSPWACWLTAIVIKFLGCQPFEAAIVVNTVAAGFFLWICNSFFLLTGIQKTFRWVLSITTVFFLSYAIFKQSFDDLWECFFLLVCLRILLNKHFLQRRDLWIWMGIFGGFAYYAKAYSFPFFILSTICCSFYLAKAWEKKNRLLWIKVSFTAILTMCIIALPWIYLLHEKYGIWMTSTAGTLNLSWYPLGHPIYKEGITHLLPPIYPGSPSYWEDPWLVNGPTPHFWNSPALFFRQIVRVGYDILLFVKCINEISPMLIAVTGLAFCILFSKQMRIYFGDKMTVIAISFLLFPLGFLPINYEARYIWYMYLPGMLLGAVVLQKLMLTPLLQNAGRNISMVVFAFSFIAFPLWDMKTMYREGEQEHKMAAAMKELGIDGSFTANVDFATGDELQKMSRLAWYSGNGYYNMPYLNVPFDELLKEMRRYHIAYFFYYLPAGTGAEALQLKDENGKPLPEVGRGMLGSYRVFRLGY